MTPTGLRQPPPCVCGHAKRVHYFGDQTLETPCSWVAGGRRPCDCTAYRPNYAEHPAT